jgi:hypothetical protein
MDASTGRGSRAGTNPVDPAESAGTESANDEYEPVREHGDQPVQRATKHVA